MAKTTPRQRKTEGRVMHEFKHGELKRGRGGKVKSRKQAIAIALSEAGASNRQSSSQKRKAKRKTARDEARGETGQQRREGKAAIETRGRRKSTTQRKSTQKRKAVTQKKSARTATKRVTKRIGKKSVKTPRRKRRSR